MAMKSALVLVVCLCMAYLGSCTTITPGTSYHKTGNTYTSYFTVDLSSEATSSSWIITVEMDDAWDSATVTVDSDYADSDYTGDQQLYTYEVKGGSSYQVKVRSSDPYTISVAEPPNYTLMVVLIVAGALLVIVAMVVIGKKTMHSAMDTPDRLVINYHGCLFICLIVCIGPLVQLILGFTLGVVPLQIVGTVFVSIAFALAGRRTVIIDANEQALTVIPYFFIIVPCCRRKVQFTNIQNFGATIRHGKHGRVSYGIRVLRFQGGPMGVSGASMGGGSALQLIPRLNDMIRRVTPQVERPPPPPLNPFMSALAQVAVQQAMAQQTLQQQQQMLAQQQMMGGGAVPPAYSAGAAPMAPAYPAAAAAPGASTAQQQAAIAAQIAALQAQQAQLAAQQGGATPAYPAFTAGVGGPTASSVPAQAVPYAAPVAVPYKPESEQPPPQNGKGDTLL